MDLRDKLGTAHSKSNSNDIITWIGHDKSRMNELMDVFLSGEKKLSQRSAMTVGDIARLNPVLIKPYLKRLVHNLDDPQHDAIIRNTVRIFQELQTIPPALQGKLYEKCFEYLTSKKYPPAIKAFSVTILRKIAHKYPELKEELIYAIEEQIPHGSVGFKNRAKKEIYNLREMKFK